MWSRRLAVNGRFMIVCVQVGNVGLTLVEQRSHFACWCMLGGPLLISTDLRQISDAALRILKARELIAMNQDSLATQGVRVGVPNATGAGVGKTALRRTLRRDPAQPR